MKLLFVSFLFIHIIGMNQELYNEYIILSPCRNEIIGYPTPEDTLRFIDIHIDKRLFTEELKDFALKADRIAFNINNDYSYYEENSMIINSPIYEYTLYYEEKEIYKSHTLFPLKYRVNHALLMSEFVLECIFPRVVQW